MSLVATRRKMKKVSGVVGTGLFVAIFIAGIFASFTFSGFKNGPGQSADLFATINGQQVSEREFEQILQQFRQFASAGRPISAQQQAMFPSQAYDLLLREFAVSDAANAYGIHLSPEEARAEVEKDVDQRLEEVGKGATAAEKAQYRQAMLSGVDMDSRRRELLGQKLQEKLTKDARPVEVKVAHVLIKAEKRTPEQALALAQEISRRARAGEDFSKLAKQYSEDLGSKDQGGQVGWASAQPGIPDPKKPDANAAKGFVPEFTAAALTLPVGKVSDPVHSTFGYHVIKALEERPFTPKEPETPAKDAKAKTKDDPAKKKQEAIDSYKSAWAQQVAQGLESDYKNRLRIVPSSVWLKSYLQEQAVNPSEPPKTPSTATDAKQVALKRAGEITPVIDGYTAAQKSSDPAAGPGLAYKIGQLSIWAGGWYTRGGQDSAATKLVTQAQEMLQKQADRYRDADLYMLLGEADEQLKDKSGALEAYKRALDRSHTDTGVLTQLQEKFKTLGHPELVTQVEAKQADVRKQQEAEQREQQERMKKFAEEQKKSQGASGSASVPVTTGGEGKVVDTVTVKTGDIDPKTGKPKILSVTHGGPEGKGNAPAANKPAANAPAANAPPSKP